MSFKPREYREEMKLIVIKYYIIYLLCRIIMDIIMDYFHFPINNRINSIDKEALITYQLYTMDTTMIVTNTEIYCS